MSFILSTPIKRSSVVFTQTVFLVASLFLMFVVSAITDIVTSLSVGIETDYAVIVLLNVGLFFVMFAVSGICFMFASIFNLSKYSYAAGGGLCVLFYINKVLGMFGDPNFVNAGMGFASMKVFDYLSIITLLDTTSVSALTTDFIWKYAILCAVGIITYAAGNVVFVKKDLPL
jgi:ABC-type transport system involved in multi-copper enzyme maturation permease subunit